MLLYIDQVPSLDRLDKLFTSAHGAAEKLFKTVEEISRAPSEVGKLTNRSIKAIFIKFFKHRSCVPRSALNHSLLIECLDKTSQCKPFLFSVDGGLEINEFCYSECKQINITED